MTEMLSDLLAYTRWDRPAERVAVDVGVVVSRVLDRLSVALSEAQVQVNVLDPLPVVESWTGALEQVFQNLMENAIKYRDPERRTVIDISCSAEKSFWRFSVSDNGIGFAQEYAEKIFGVFKRLHGQNSPYGGTGIGLAVVRRIIDRHCGHVWAESSPGRGATFRFTIPANSYQFETFSTGKQR
jgi:light-regulated signal transduction histidine kinase (bacteriophytochrome)